MPVGVGRPSVGALARLMGLSSGSVCPSLKVVVDISTPSAHVLPPPVCCDGLHGLSRISCNPARIDRELVVGGVGPERAVG